MLPVGLEPTISAGERPQTALDSAATGTGNFLYWKTIITFCSETVKQVCFILQKYQKKSENLSQEFQVKLL